MTERKPRWQRRKERNEKKLPTTSSDSSTSNLSSTLSVFDVNVNKEGFYGELPPPPHRFDNRRLRDEDDEDERSLKVLVQSGRCEMEKIETAKNGIEEKKVIHAKSLQELLTIGGKSSERVKKLLVDLGDNSPKSDSIMKRASLLLDIPSNTTTTGHYPTWVVDNYGKQGNINDLVISCFTPHRMMYDYELFKINDFHQSVTIGKYNCKFGGWKSRPYRMIVAEPPIDSERLRIFLDIYRTGLCHADIYPEILGTLGLTGSQINGHRNASRHFFD
jgi:hypothetical protein